MTRPMTVLVTGGAGYVGSALVANLLEHGHRVRVVDDLLFGAESLLPFQRHERFAFRKGDVRETERHLDWFEGADAVVHLAAIVGFPACQQVGREVAWRFNVEATERVFEASDRAGVDRFVFASTYSNYGKSEDGRAVTEESPLFPQSLYAETKIAAEEALRRAAASSETVPILFRFATLFGVSPRTRFDLIVNQFVLEAITKRRIVIYQRGYHRSFVHVADVVRAIELVLEWPDPERLRGEVFNVGSDDGNYSKDEILELLAREVRGLEIEHKDLSFGGDMRDLRVSFEKIHRVLGYRTTIGVPEGIRELRRALEEGWIPDPNAPRYRNATFIVQ